ncbi:sigma 54-interacting transcriptional regulator [Liquorilactobacillus uvarum]|uniref:sigma 54-interacting transcriptional regulator n=1 Tax=Liquorilactobacillus uvarum TaxID=303240 RepID=UPI002889A166|nr:sigma 54-interacting transcriptional regulator [Liquorilactobacillus uvarum]
MKKARFKVRDALKELLNRGHQKISTEEIAKAAGLTRGVTSSYLSQLRKDGLVVKYGTKPIYWKIKENTDVFSKFIGSSGSLRKVIESSKSSVVYPPSGFPLIITGPSGTGKSYLASLIYKYAHQKHAIAESAKFIVLNCADYANNPELLSSVLFGYKKGAFTGAEKDTAGLVEQADGGYLFLDEIHRLPIESQEKLFTLLDTGYYYPLGESKEARQVHIRFIFATTEKLDNYLLQTFRRRVPLKLELPSFSKRPLFERYQIILHFFYQEAVSIQCDLKIAYGILRSLVAISSAGNIGTIQNKVKLMCADAYRNDNTDRHYITIDNKQVFLEEYILLEYQKVENFEPIMSVGDKQAVLKLISVLKKNEHQNAPISDNVLEIQSFLHDMKQAVLNIDLDEKMADVMAKRVKKVISSLRHRYGLSLNISDNDVRTLTQFLDVMIHFSEQLNLKDIESLARSVKKRYPRTTYLAALATQQLNFKEIPQNLVILAMVFLIFAPKVNDIEKIDMLAIIVSHGETMAASIQSIVNNLCGNYIFESFDMPIETSMMDISKKIGNFINQQSQTYKGTILMFDMGSLSQMYKEIKPLLSSDLLVINNVTTATALDIGLQIQQNNQFKEIAEKAESYRDVISTQYYEGLSQKQNIIVSCMSGEGLSKEIKNIIKKVSQTDTDIITMDYKDLKNSLDNHDHEYFRNTKVILTTTDIPQHAATSIINIYDIMDKPGTQKLYALLKELGESDQSINALIEELLKFFTIEGIGDRLEFLNPEVVIKEVQKITSKYEKYYHLSLSGKIKLNLYMHISLMLERTLVSNNSSNKGHTIHEQMSEAQLEFYSVSKNIFHDVEVKYNITVNDYEISLMYELLRPLIVD